MLPAHHPDVRREELTRSRLVLEQLLGRPVTSLSYPYGACDLTTADIAREVGFELACTVESEPVTQDSDPLRIPRMEVRRQTASRLHGLLQRALDPAA
jgi:peptidoglycan/xylan/chitin deacetylase (PgdA/CDA1 family)